MSSTIETDIAKISMVRQKTDDILRSFLEDRTERATTRRSKEMIRELGRFAFRGGKRIRPLFCYWGWRGATEDGDESEILTSATALELFHIGALIHDDLIDDSDLRRGLPTMHRIMADLHAAGRGRGSSDSFGRSAALLLGDACVVWADELFHSRPARTKPNPRADALFARLRADTVHGEGLDLFGEAFGAQLADALDIVRYKTASYTVRYPLQLGAALAGADPALFDDYDEFGVLIGEAFQLRDDLCGIYGDPAVTGKSVVDDVRQGKPTVLIAVARNLARPAESRQIDELYGLASVDDAQAARLRETVEATGARRAVEEMIRERCAAARRCLADADIRPEARAALELLTSAATERVA
jgi:geranylgeranyl diphosphate synthase type I